MANLEQGTSLGDETQADPAASPSKRDFRHRQRKEDLIKIRRELAIVRKELQHCTAELEKERRVRQNLARDLNQLLSWRARSPMKPSINEQPPGEHTSIDSMGHGLSHDAQWLAPNAPSWVGPQVGVPAPGV